MVSSVRRDRALGYVDAARTSGVRVVAGGGRPQSLPDGWFVEPTVIAHMDNSNASAQEEVSDALWW